MRRTSLRELHLNTSAILNEVAKGESFIIEKRGVSIAELRPVETLPRTNRLPDREDFIASLPIGLDSGAILEEDRS